MTLADQVNAVTTSIEEIHYWRGRALAVLGDTRGAAQAIQQALALNPTFVPAQQAAAELNSNDAKCPRTLHGVRQVCPRRTSMR